MNRDETKFVAANNDFVIEGYWSVNNFVTYSMYPVLHSITQSLDYAPVFDKGMHVGIYGNVKNENELDETIKNLLRKTHIREVGRNCCIYYIDKHKPIAMARSYYQHGDELMLAGNKSCHLYTSICLNNRMAIYEEDGNRCTCEAYNIATLLHKYLVQKGFTTVSMVQSNNMLAHGIVLLNPDDM